MKIKNGLTAIILGWIVFLVFSICWKEKDILASPLIEKYSGVCYGPFRDGQDPEHGIFPTVQEVSEDIAFIKKLSKSLRTYGMGGTGKDIPKICQISGIDCYPGAWISRDKRGNEKEVNALIDIGRQRLSAVKGLIVGNEVLLRNDLSKESLIDLIRRVKKETGLPVTTADIWDIWLKNPELAKEVDFILVHIHPYWEGVRVEESADKVIQKLQELKN